MVTDCPILYEDAQLILINKPAGTLSHPNPGALSSRNRGAFQGEYDFNHKTFATESGPIWLLHRLDQDTSGVLLAAKDSRSAELCREAFDSGEVRKDYLCLLRGDPGVRGIWKDHLSLKRDGSKARSVVLRGHAPNAELHFRRLGYSTSHRMSLVQVELMTGKTHQIRVQAKSRQHPLCGDDIYGDFSWNKKMQRELGLGRLFLHAWRLQLQHPSTKRLLRIEAPLPEELEQALQRLELSASEKKSPPSKR
jgi:RluA family pseudouridine synthase